MISPRAYRGSVASEAAQLEAALKAAGRDVDDETIWDIWQSRRLRAALAALAKDVMMMSTALSERRMALAHEAAQIQAAHDATIAGLAAGTTTAAQVAKLAAPASALASALAQLDTQIAEHEAHTAQDAQAAARQAQIAYLVAQSQAAGTARSEFEAAHLAGAAAIEQAIGHMLTGMAAWSDARASFLAALRKLAPSLYALSYHNDPAAEQALDALLDELASVGAGLPSGLARGWWAHVP